MFNKLRVVSANFLKSISVNCSRYFNECPVNSWNADIEAAGGFSCTGSVNDGSALILGVYPEDNHALSQTICLTKTAALFNHNINGKLVEMLKASGPLPNIGEFRVFPKLEPMFSLVAVVGLGDNNAGYEKREQRDESKENIRKAVGVACRYFQGIEVNKIFVEGFEDPESAAEGAFLALWENQHLRAPERRKIKIPDVVMYGDCDWKKWRIGVEKAEAQNFARKLMETPANLMTPRAFAYNVVQALCKTSVNVTLRGETWLKEHNMNAFLANTKGSPQPPFLLEMTYNGCDPAIPPIILIGKGITFNSGGLCLKTCEEMKHMRGDMQGAAVVVATFKALANLGLPINVRGLIPLGENMPGGTAARPRDIIKSTSGKSILISPRDFNGSLMLADTLCYAQQFKPKYIVSLATLSKEVKTAFNLSASGIYTQNEKLWQLLKTSSIHSGDRLWKLPMWNMYEREVKDFTSADLSILSKYFRRGISATTTALLNQFVCKPNWALIDTYGTMFEDGKTSYIKKGMSGRPTRTMVEFLGQMAYPPREMLEQSGSNEEEGA
ncbi:cytosol aminopeptidase-like [Homalodisca vitripennis]|uniref:cytosol aminopeptidase-like n=1 Tax=Homalodisca vitripennis TaxID=197043 RepID=UPI001EEA287C|nr:cytosol aminopeptidase-like [Homalodisca vitripennis]KAG8321805.1 bleomycin hydrolase [Homalodisca vitripennis]